MQEKGRAADGSQEAHTLFVASGDEDGAGAVSDEALGDAGAAEVCGGLVEDGAGGDDAGGEGVVVRLGAQLVDGGEDGLVQGLGAVGCSGGWGRASRSEGGERSSAVGSGTGGWVS